MASYSVGESLLSHYAQRLAVLEHRYLLVQLMPNRIPGCEVLFVCSELPTADVVDYYGTLVGADAAARMRTRVSHVVVPDRSARSLAPSCSIGRTFSPSYARRLVSAPAVIEP